MEKSARERLIEWLKDAHAMESGIETVLEAHAKNAMKEGYEEIAHRAEVHLEETRSQKERVAECLKSLGSDASAGRAGWANLVSAAKAVGEKMSGDEIIKAAISDYATEFFEIASYRAIIETAKQCGEDEVAEVCKSILKEELSMAEWLEEHLPDTVNVFLAKA